MTKKVALLVLMGILFMTSGCSKTQQSVPNSAPTVVQATAPTQGVGQKSAADARSSQTPTAVEPPASDSSQGFDPNLVEVEGVKIGMTRPAIMAILMSQSYGPPACIELDSKIKCNTQAGRRVVYFDLSVKDETVTSVTLFAPASQFPAMVRKLTARLGKPNEDGPTTDPSDSRRWRSSDKHHILEIIDDAPDHTILSLKREPQ